MHPNHVLSSEMCQIQKRCVENTLFLQPPQLPLQLPQLAHHNHVSSLSPNKKASPRLCLGEAQSLYGIDHTPGCALELISRAVKASDYSVAYESLF